MDKSELIKLKEEVSKLKKSYSKVFFNGTVDDNIYVEPLESYCNLTEIFEKYDPIIDEKIALSYFEKCFLEIVRNATLKGIDFDGIKGSIYISYFVSEDMINNIDKNCNLPIAKFDKNDLLKDLVEITFNFDFITDKNNEAAERYLNNSREIYDKSFIVNYERFTSYLVSKEFVINAKTFYEALNNNLNGKYSTITLDFTKNYKKVIKK